MKSIREAPVVNKRTLASFLVGDDNELTTCTTGSTPMAQSLSTSESRNDQETTTAQRLAMEDPCRLIMEKVVVDRASILEEFGKEFPYQDDEESTLPPLDHQPHHLRHTPTSFCEEEEQPQQPLVLNKPQPNERSPVSVARVTDIHNPQDMDHDDEYHVDDYDALAFPLDLPALLPELDDDDDDDDAIGGDTCNLASCRKRNLDTLDSSTTRTESSSSSSSSMFIAPRWDHERKRPKQEESTRAASTSSPCHPTSPNTLEGSHKNDCNIHTPSLLEVAVGYGFHLARCRLEQEQNHCELSGILDPTRRIQDILQDGAQTVVRMKDDERRLFWKYMMMNNANQNKDPDSSSSSSSSSSPLL